MLGGFRSKMKNMLSQVTVEPVMFLDGACHWSMQVFMEVVQMHKICSVSLGLPHEICANLSSHPEENIQVQKEFSMFVFQNSIIMSILPLIFVLFMGSWSDKYGRKIPLIMTTLCHVLWSGGYLLNSWQASWPMEFIYLVTFFDSIGGGPQGLVSTSVAYISDVTPITTRTGRVSIAMSLWYFGGPLGNLVGAVAIQYGGINLALGIVFMVHMSVLCYIIIYIKESHGPFVQIQPIDDCPRSEGTLKKEDITKTKMVLDFFNWRRVAEAFRTAFRRRDGYTRVILLTVVASNMIRRAARGFYMYSFVRRALEWEAAIYTYWTSYRTMVAASGSLVLVPILTRLIAITDPMLIAVGSLSLVGEYCCYGFVSGAPMTFLIWMGPLAGLISNASIIAQKSLATKLVSSTEKGRVSAVMSATQSLMPMVGYAMYAPIYQKTVETFPEAQFFFAASMATIIMVTFISIHLSSIVEEMKKADPEKEMPKEDKSIMETKPKVDLKLSSVSETLGSSSSSSSSSFPSSFTKESNKEDQVCSRITREDGDVCIERSGVKKCQSIKESSTSSHEGNDDGMTPCYENKMSDEDILASEKVGNPADDLASGKVGNGIAVRLGNGNERETDQRDKRRF